jgi:hypothetical protein
MNMIKRARKELELAGWFDKDGLYEDMVGKAVMELLEVFAKQGHSGMSATLVVNLFKILVNGDTLTPLTGEDDEWDLVYEDEHLYQNNRNYKVFKNDKGAYFSDGIVFIDKDGVSFTGSQSVVPMPNFPCVPPAIVYIHEGTPEAEAYKGVFDK